MNSEILRVPSLGPAVISAAVFAGIGFLVGRFSGTEMNMILGALIGFLLASHGQWADMTTKRLMRIEEKLDAMAQS